MADATSLRDTINAVLRVAQLDADCGEVLLHGQEARSAATSRLSPRAMLHRWAFMVMCWAGGVTIAVTWHGRTADWIGGMVYGIGIGRLILRDD